MMLLNKTFLNPLQGRYPWRNNVWVRNKFLTRMNLCLVARLSRILVLKKDVDVVSSMCLCIFLSTKFNDNIFS